MRQRVQFVQAVFQQTCLLEARCELLRIIMRQHVDWVQAVILSFVFKLNDSQPISVKQRIQVVQEQYLQQ